MDVPNDECWPHFQQWTRAEDALETALAVATTGAAAAAAAAAVVKVVLVGSKTKSVAALTAAIAAAVTVAGAAAALAAKPVCLNSTAAWPRRLRPFRAACGPFSSLSFRDHCAFDSLRSPLLRHGNRCGWKWGPSDLSSRQFFLAAVPRTSAASSLASRVSPAQSTWHEKQAGPRRPPGDPNNGTVRAGFRQLQRRRRMKLINCGVHEVQKRRSGCDSSCNPSLS
jgi:hypothetical protein